MSRKKLMILGAGRGQVELIQAAKELGYTTVVASIKGNYPGFQLADEISYADISNPEQVYQAAQEFHVDGIATACLDTGIAALGYACERLGFTGLSERAARISGNKFLMKEAFQSGGVNTAGFRKIDSEQDLIDAFQILSFPLVIKAVDLQGSRGVYVVGTKEEALEAFHLAMMETRKDFCIAEEFITGEKFTAEAFVYKGEMLFCLPCGDNVFHGDTPVPVGHYVPFKEDQDVLQRACEQVQLAIKAIGLDNCAVNADLILKDDGSIFVIELTGRAGANCLREITSLHYGIEYYKMIAAMAAGDNPLPFFKKENGCAAVAAQMVISSRCGRIKRITDHNKPEDFIKEVTFFVRKGDNVEVFRNCKDCLGQVVVTANTHATAAKRIGHVLENLEIELE